MRPLSSSLTGAMESYLRGRNDLKDRTKHDYAYAVERFVRASGDTISALTEDGVNDYLAGIRASRSMARVHTIALRLLGRWLAARGILPADPLAHVSTPKARKHRREELPDHIAEAAMEIAGRSRFGVRDRAIVMLGLCTGVRPSEMRQLRLEDVYLGQGFLRVQEDTSKTPEGHRIVPLDKRVISAIDDYVNDFRYGSGETLFLTQHGDTFTENGWASLFARLRDALRREGIEGFTAYRMRHTAITNWRRIGIHPSDMQQMAGHKSFQTTQGYIGKRRAEELVRLPSAFSQIYRKVG